MPRLIPLTDCQGFNAKGECSYDVHAAQSSHYESMELGGMVVVPPATDATFSNWELVRRALDETSNAQEFGSIGEGYLNKVAKSRRSKLRRIAARQTEKEAKLHPSINNCLSSTIYMHCHIMPEKKLSLWRIFMYLVIFNVSKIIFPPRKRAPSNFVLYSCFCSCIFNLFPRVLRIYLHLCPHSPVTTTLSHNRAAFHHHPSTSKLALYNTY